MKKYLTAIAICILLLSGNIVAQLPVSDSALRDIASKNIVQAYASTLGGYNNLYNGAEYIYAYAGIKGHPYFKTDSFQNSSLFYDQVLYRDIPLKYDLVTNEVVINGRQDRLLTLVPEKLNYFIIGGELFLHIRKDSGEDHLLEPGYYQVLHEGVVTVLASRRKTAIRSLRAEDPYQFATYNRYFLRKNHGYQIINSKKDLLSFFDSDKEQIKTFSKKSKLSFKKSMEETILKTVAYYEKIKN